MQRSVARLAEPEQLRFFLRGNGEFWMCGAGLLGVHREKRQNQKIHPPIIGVDAAESEPPKVSIKWHRNKSCARHAAWKVMGDVPKMFEEREKINGLIREKIMVANLLSRLQT